MPNESIDIFSESAELKTFKENCYLHASDLITGARLLHDSKLAHLAYHLAVAALEEIGKAELAKLSTFGNKNEERDILEKLGDNHVKKLFWAIWSESFGKNIITKEQIEEFTTLANFIHSKRMDGLYVSLDLTNKMRPQDLVKSEDAEILIRLAEVSLKLKGSIELEQLRSCLSANLEYPSDLCSCERSI